MNIEENKVVSLTFNLRLNDEEGELVEKVEKEKPLTFLYNAGNILEPFEENIKGMQPGDDFSFQIDSEKAYGPVREEAVIDLPKEAFKVEGELRTDLLQEGVRVPMRDQEGNPVEGKVVEIGEEEVKMDFNHPLAGENLHFSGEVIDVREATQEELQQGQAGEAQQ